MTPRKAVPAPTKPKPVVALSVEQTVRTAARKHGVDEDHLVRIARCESTLNPSAVNYGYAAGGGNPTGLFQYLPETWTRIGSRSPYGVRDVYSARDQAEVTAWAFANGYAGEWACK